MCFAGVNKKKILPRALPRGINVFVCGYKKMGRKKYKQKTRNSFVFLFNLTLHEGVLKMENCQLSFLINFIVFFTNKKKNGSKTE